MNKPKSLEGLKTLLKETERDRTRFEHEHVTKKVREYERQLYTENELYLKAYRDKISQIKNEIALKEQSLKEKRKIPEHLQRYLDRTWSSGVDWGYTGVTLRYVDPKNRFWIVTSNGGTGGTGTAMGTGGYYYAECSHFVTFPQYGDYLNCRLPDRKDNSFFSSNTRWETHGGKLSKERMKTLIELAEEYCKEWNVIPFTIENGKLQTNVN